MSDIVAEPQVLVRLPDASGAYHEQWLALSLLKGYGLPSAPITQPTLDRNVLLAAVRAWREEDEAEHRQVWEELRQAIGEHRL